MLSPTMAFCMSFLLPSSLQTNVQLDSRRPRSGKSLTFCQTFRAIKSVYCLSTPTAFLLTIGGFVECGHWEGFRRILDLHDLALHNRIEHNASLVHDDAPDGAKWAKWETDETLVDALLSEGVGHNEEANSAPKGNTVNANNGSSTALKLDNLLSARRRRIVAMVSNPSIAPTLSTVHKIIIKGETSLITLVFGSTGDVHGTIDRGMLRTWMGGDRLPDGWSGTVSGKEVTMGTLGTVNKLVDVDKMLADAKKDAGK